MRGRTSGILSEEEEERENSDWEDWDWIGLKPTLPGYTGGERE